MPKAIHSLTQLKRQEESRLAVTGPGPDLKGGGSNWAVAQRPTQLRGLHKNSKKSLPKET